MKKTKDNLYAVFNRFIFRAVYIQHYYRKYRDFSYITGPKACIASRIIKCPRGGTFVITDERILTYHNHPKSTVCIQHHS